MMITGSDKLSLAAQKGLSHHKGENEEAGAQETRNLGLNLGTHMYTHRHIHTHTCFKGLLCARHCGKHLYMLSPLILTPLCHGLFILSILHADKLVQVHTARRVAESQLTHACLTAKVHH